MKYPWKFRKVCSGNPSGNTNKHSSLITRVSLADSRVFNPQMVCQRWLSPCFHSVSLRLVTNIKKKFDIPQRDLAPCMPCVILRNLRGIFFGCIGLFTMPDSDSDTRIRIPNSVATVHYAKVFTLHEV